MNKRESIKIENESLYKCIIDSILKVFTISNDKKVYKQSVIEFQMRALNILNCIIKNNSQFTKQFFS